MWLKEPSLPATHGIESGKGFKQARKFIFVLLRNNGL